jgi:hypothetical protein
LGVLLIACLVGSVVAAPAAPAKRLTAKQKRVIKKKLMRQVKKHPRVVLRKSWLRKADMVDFNLPTTIRLNPAASNTPVFSGDFTGVGRYRPDFNTTNANTVASDDTALLNLGPSLGSRTLKLGGTVNANISFHDVTDPGSLGDVDISLTGGTIRTTSLPLLGNTNTTTVNQPTGCADYVFQPSAALDVDSFQNMGDQGSNFPMPDGSGAGDVVLRTAPLALAATGSGNANLFNQPTFGGTAVNVKTTLSTNINTILREVDQGGFGVPQQFNCRQALTGIVANTLGAKLTGSLRISPAITGDGYLRLAKVNLGGPAVRNSVEACLVPFQTLANLIPGPANPTAYTSASPPGAGCNAASPFLDPLGLQHPAANAQSVKLTADVQVTNLTGEVLVGSGLPG